MKFPQEIAKIVANVIRAKEKQEYLNIFKLKSEILSCIDELRKTEVLDELIISAFNLKYYNEVILIGEELLKVEYETDKGMYYILLSCLVNNDIYHALSIIKRSKLINHPEIKRYLETDGANLSLVLGMSNKDFNLKMLIIIVNLINGIGIEMMMGIDTSLEYIFGRMLELIDQLYEMGYPLEIIEELTNKVKMLFLN